MSVASIKQLHPVRFHIHHTKLISKQAPNMLMRWLFPEDQKTDETVVELQNQLRMSRERELELIERVQEYKDRLDQYKARWKAQQDVILSNSKFGTSVNAISNFPCYSELALEYSAMMSQNRLHLLEVLSDNEDSEIETLIGDYTFKIYKHVCGVIRDTHDDLMKILGFSNEGIWNATLQYLRDHRATPSLEQLKYKSFTVLQMGGDGALKDSYIQSYTQDMLRLCWKIVLSNPPLFLVWSKETAKFPDLQVLDSQKYKTLVCDESVNSVVKPEKDLRNIF